MNLASRVLSGPGDARLVGVCLCGSRQGISAGPVSAMMGVSRLRASWLGNKSGLLGSSPVEAMRRDAGQVRAGTTTTKEMT